MDKTPHRVLAVLSAIGLIGVAFKDRFNCIMVIKIIVITGVKSTNKIQQLMDFNNVCYDKVLHQGQKGYQVTF